MHTRHFEHWFHPAASLQVPDLDLAVLRDPAIADTAKAFLSNIEQLGEAALTPLLLVVYARAQQSINDQACLQVFGDLESRTLDDPRVEEFTAAAKQHWARWDAANSPADAFGQQIFLAAGELDQLQDGQLSVRRGLEATLRGIVLGAWTAFEVLSSDLWEAAVNAYPRKLAALKGDTSVLRRPKPSFGAFQDAASEPTSSGKLVRLDFLQANDFNLSSKMGTVLRERFNFQVLGGIQEAYLSAFAQPDSRVRSIFLDPVLDALASTRNVLAHRSGVVDEQFINQHRRLSALQTIFPVATAGSRLTLSGLRTHQLIQPVLSLAAELVLVVDGLSGELK